MELAEKTVLAFATRYQLHLEHHPHPRPDRPVTTSKGTRWPQALYVLQYGDPVLFIPTRLEITAMHDVWFVHRPERTMRGRKRGVWPSHPSYASTGLRAVYEWLFNQHRSCTLKGKPKGHDVAVTLKPLRTIDASGEPTLRFGCTVHPHVADWKKEVGFVLATAHFPFAMQWYDGQMESDVFRDWLMDHQYLEQA